MVLRAGGVVRGLANWGTFMLPRRVRAHQATHAAAQYFVMRFDARGGAQTELRRVLRLDPRLVRFSVVRLGRSLAGSGGVASVPGAPEWRHQPSYRGRW